MGVLGTRVNIGSKFFRPTKDDAVILAQRAEAVLDTRPGTYWNNPEYGLALDDFINAELTAESFARLASKIKAALQSDSFFREATIAVGVVASTQQAGGLALKFAATIALPGGEPVAVTIQTSALGVTVGV